MDGLQSLTALAETIRMAHWVYQNGFSKARSAHKQYIEFGVAIQNLGTNLTNIEKIIQNAKRQLDQGRLRPMESEPPWDFRSLEQIVGNYQKTIADAERFIKNKSRFNHEGSFVANIIWNAEFADEVTRLRDRVAFHNVKILMVLHPLELKLLSDLRELIIDFHEETTSRLQRIETLLVQSPTAEGQADTTLAIPEELKARFDQVLVEVHPECQDPVKFPLQNGMDAFIQHFNEGISTFETDSYLNLMKCLWIMERVKESEEYKQELSRGSLWRHYVYTMENKLSKECTRLLDARVPVPDVSTVLRLPQEEFRIWADAEDPAGEGDMLDSSFHMTELLNITLPVDKSNGKHNLRVLQNVDGTVQIQDSKVTFSGAREISTIQRFDADLSKAYLLPYYALPGSTDTAFNLKFKSDRDSASGIPPSFAALNDLLAFQGIITGYETLYYRGDIDVESYTASKFSLRGSYKKEKGKVQIWRKSRPSPARSEDGRSDSSSYETANPTTLAQATPAPLAENERRGSRFSTSPIPKDFAPARRRESSAAGSIFSTASYAPTVMPSLADTTFSASYTTLIEMSGKKGIMMEKPEPPRMILFLKKEGKNPEDSTFSYLSVELDQDTHINVNSCECRKRNTQCKLAVIEKVGGKSLTARRFVSQDGLQGWNLAAMGAYQEERATTALRDLRLVNLTFQTRQHLEHFTQKLNDIKLLYTARLNSYHREMQTMATQHFAGNSFHA